MVFILRAQIIYIHIVLYVVTVRSAQPLFIGISPLLLFLQCGCWMDSATSAPPVLWISEKHMAIGQGQQKCTRNSSANQIHTLHPQWKESDVGLATVVRLCVIGMCFVLPFCLKNSQRTQKEMMLPKPTVPCQPPGSHFINVPGMFPALLLLMFPDSSCKTQNIIT